MTRSDETTAPEQQQRRARFEGFVERQLAGLGDTSAVGLERRRRPSSMSSGVRPMIMRPPTVMTRPPSTGAHLHGSGNSLSDQVIEQALGNGCAFGRLAPSTRARSTAIGRLL